MPLQSATRVTPPYGWSAALGLARGRGELRGLGVSDRLFSSPAPDGTHYSWLGAHNLRTFGENQAVLNGPEFQDTVDLKSQRLDFAADLMDRHPLRFVLGPERMSFRKFDDDQPSSRLQSSAHGGYHCFWLGKFVIGVGDQDQVELRLRQTRVIFSTQHKLDICQVVFPDSLRG